MAQQQIKYPLKVPTKIKKEKKRIYRSLSLALMLEISEMASYDFKTLITYS